MNEHPMCSKCGGPLTRGADAVARLMADEHGENVNTGVVIGDNPAMCWACANAFADAWRREHRQGRLPRRCMPHGGETMSVGAHLHARARLRAQSTIEYGLIIAAIVIVVVGGSG
jgi:hypothetical protein